MCCVCATAAKNRCALHKHDTTTQPQHNYDQKTPVLYSAVWRLCCCVAFSRPRISLEKRSRKPHKSYPYAAIRYKNTPRGPTAPGGANGVLKRFHLRRFRRLHFGSRRHLCRWHPEHSGRLVANPEALPASAELAYETTKLVCRPGPILVVVLSSQVLQQVLQHEPVAGTILVIQLLPRSSHQQILRAISF